MSEVRILLTLAFFYLALFFIAYNATSVLYCWTRGNAASSYGQVDANCTQRTTATLRRCLWCHGKALAEIGGRL